MPFFTYAYQPIVRTTDGQLFGYEALCRPHAAVASSVDELLSTARSAGWAGDLGAYMRDRSTELLPQIPDDVSLFLNVHPTELDIEFMEWAIGRVEDASRLVIEVIESSALARRSVAHDVLRDLRAMGFRIAIDDLGAGYANLSTLAFLKADFVKLDRGLIQNVPGNPRVGRLLRHLIDFAHEEDMFVVAEGIETEAEFDALKALGPDLMQGFWLGRPGDVPALH